MKIMHLSDLHIGLKLINRSMLKDQQFILGQITEIAKKQNPDAIVIAGDIYDKPLPSAEAVKVFDDFISALSVSVPETEIMIISGNHDSAQRVDVFRSILSKHRIHMIGNPPVYPDEYIERVTLCDDFGNVNFFLLPFIKPSTVRLITGNDGNGNSLSYNEAVHRIIERENINITERNVLVSHQFYLKCGTSPDTVERMDSETVTVGNIDNVYADVLEKFDYAALGHIHKPSDVGSEFYRYCGTPVACSVSEAGQQKGVIIAELAEKGNIKTSVIPLKPLHEVRIIEGSFDEIMEQGCDDYVTAVITEKTETGRKDTKNELKSRFPNLLEVRMDNVIKPDYRVKYSADKEMDVFELCKSFLSDTDESEQEILRDVINTVKEEAEI
ncbi:MAG: exonuclease SbcCD subunit D [Ruminococcus sp.]|nr:exonuclease SbcCD subunit D [Ruminococcus sp.]